MPNTPVPEKKTASAEIPKKPMEEEAEAQKVSGHDEPDTVQASAPEVKAAEEAAPSETKEPKEALATPEEPVQEETETHVAHKQRAATVA